jgi:hypothetical protein
MNETHILIRLLWIYIPRNWEFGSALAKLWNFGGGGVSTPKNPPSVRHMIEVIGRCGRRRRKLLDDLKERGGYCRLKEEAIDRGLKRLWTCCETDC